MDEQRFDQFSRRLAGVRTRRQAIKAIAGALVAGIGGTRAAEAQSCTPHYRPCGSDGQCCVGAVCEYGLCMPGCRIDGAFTSAWMPSPDTICAVCTPELSTTSWSPANEGMSCWSGDPGAGITTCQQGVCRSTGPVDCRPLTACHTATINPQTGQCVQAYAAAGSPCGGQEMCHDDRYTPADTCDGNGFCIGGGSQTRSCAPYICGGGTCTSSCASDTDCAGGAHCDDGQCYTDLDLGQPCDEDSDCKNGICVDGVCCNQRCTGLCETCTAETRGVCSPVVCDDGLSCTSGTCDEATGTCGFSLNPGTCLIAGVCYPNGAENPADRCQICDSAATSAEWSAKICTDGLGCTTDTCNPSTGACVFTLNPGSCLIGGSCYADGAINPANACQICDSAADDHGWSAVDCADDGLSCTTTTCDPGVGCTVTVNPGSCLIAGVCYADGVENPAYKCQVCYADTNQNTWSDRVCPEDELTCTTATCNFVDGCSRTINLDACLIGGACYADGAVNQQNACQVCDPARSRTSWSARVCPAPVPGATPYCESGECGFICPDGMGVCENTCLSLDTVTNCGACGNTCTEAPDNGSPACVNGACGFTCNDGFEASDGACAPVDACGNTCTEAPENSSPACVDGTCGFTCNDGFEAIGDGCAPVDGYRCYWMLVFGENQWQWVNVPSVSTYGACKRLDGCSECGGRVLTGCYKWATSPTDAGFDFCQA